MSDPKKTIFERKSQHVINALAERNIEALYFSETKDAVDAICGMIPAGSLVGLGGSVTVVDSGLVAALRKLNVKLLDRYRDGVSKEEIAEMRHQGLSSDVFIASSNAVTSDGRIVNMDGYGNRVASIIFGPKKVILMISANKIVPTLPDAVSRIRNVAAPMNCIRFDAGTPCALTGFCDEANCKPPARICSQLTVIENNLTDGRITVVFVGEELGF